MNKVVNIKEDICGRRSVVRLEDYAMDLYVVFADGELNILPPLDMHFVEFAKMIQQFFEKDSEFIPDMEKFFGEKINSISFEFNGIGLNITPENSFWYDIVEQFLYTKETAWYGNGFVVTLDKNSALQFKNETARANWIKAAEKQSFDIIDLARRWAKIMQFHLREGEKLEDIVDMAYQQANLTGDSSTGTIEGLATNMLVQCWKYGDELKKICIAKRRRAF